MITPRPAVNVQHLPDADMQAALVALARAARRAGDLAMHSGTPLVVSENDRVVEKPVIGLEGEACRSARWTLLTSTAPDRRVE